MRSPHPPHEPPPVYSPRRRHNSPCGRVRCLSRLRMASVAAAWSMGFSSLAPGGRSSGACLTLHLPPGERNAHARRPARALSPLSAAHILRMSAAGYARQSAARTRARPRQHMTRIQNREGGGVAEKPVICLPARNFRLVCLGPRAQPTLHPANLSPSQSLTNQEAGPICRCFSILS